MWLIMFQPIGTNQFVPQLLCSSEQEAKKWVQNAPFSVVGSYIYMFVPLARPTGYFIRQEPMRSDWQNAIGTWENPNPLMYD